MLVPFCFHYWFRASSDHDIVQMLVLWFHVLVPCCCLELTWNQHEISMWWSLELMWMIPGTVYECSLELFINDPWNCLWMIPGTVYKWSLELFINDPWNCLWMIPGTVYKWSLKLIWIIPETVHVWSLKPFVNDSWKLFEWSLKLFMNDPLNCCEWSLKLLDR